MSGGWMTTEPCELALTRETGGDKDDGGGGGRSPILHANGLAIIELWLRIVPRVAPLCVKDETAESGERASQRNRLLNCLPSRTLAEAVTTTDIWSASSAASNDHPKEKKQNRKYRTRLDACGCFFLLGADALTAAAGISARSAHRPRLNGWLGQIDFRDEASWELCRRCHVGTGGFGSSCGRRSGLSLSILGDQSIQR